MMKINIVKKYCAKYGIEESDLPGLRREYEKLAEEYVNSQKESQWTFFHFNIDLEAGPCIQKRIHGCGVGVEYIAVSPDGSIYPCHQFDGIKETKLGDVFNGITNKELQEKFRKANFYLTNLNVPIALQDSIALVDALQTTI